MSYRSHDKEDVERYRQQSRQADRGYRQQQQQHQQHSEDNGRRRHQQGRHHDRKNYESSSSSSSPSALKQNRDSSSVKKVEINRQKKITSEREQRMARLRQELKKEDENLVALDRIQAEKCTSVLSAQNQQDESQLKPQTSIIEVNPEELEGMDEEEQMKKLLGFDGFGSTKGDSVEDNQSTAARGVAAKNKARKYRQYMNRKSGFNRPLEKMN